MPKRAAGIGSLPKLKTLDAQPMSTRVVFIKGYRRDWRMVFYADDLRLLALALVEDPNAQGSLPAVLLEFSDEDFPTILERECDYRLIDVDCFYRQTDAECVRALSFAAPLREEIAVVENSYIALTYIATAAEGFEDHLGANGIEQFLETTSFDNRTILDDRDSPLYSRNHASDRTFETVISILKSNVPIVRRAFGDFSNE